jgi:predicted MPP superfamily phosphohydrolase
MADPRSGQNSDNGSENGTRGAAGRRDVVRIAAVGDVHCSAAGRGTLAPLFQRIADAADVLVLCGDLTDYGLPEEARVLAGELSAAKIPTLAVLGNHDFESGKVDEVRKLLEDQAGIMFLDGDAREVAGSGSPGPRGSAAGSAAGRWGRGASRPSRRSSRRRSTSR